MTQWRRERANTIMIRDQRSLCERVYQKNGSGMQNEPAKGEVNEIPAKNPFATELNP